ncbi:MAG: hypothetical protein WAO30_10095, partial [Thermacetogeniaceae bacterium]
TRPQLRDDQRDGHYVNHIQRRCQACFFALLGFNSAGLRFSLSVPVLLHCFKVTGGHLFSDLWLLTSIFARLALLLHF